jgi:hypothetical protein
MAPEQDRPHNSAVIRCLCSYHSRVLLKPDGQFLSPISSVKIQDSIVAESDAMSSMAADLDMNAKFNGGFFSGCLRNFSEGNLFL